MNNPVPCNGCTLCCKGDAIFMHPECGDDAAQYQTVTAPDGRLMLAHKPNGDCVYLEAGGCAIHGSAPTICRELDCRVLAKKLGYTMARKMIKRGMLNSSVIRRGNELRRIAR